MRKWTVMELIGLGLACLPYTFFPENRDWFRLDAGWAAETDFGGEGGRTFGWQDRERVCVALTPAQCTAVVQLQSGGSDGSGSGDAGAGDAGASGPGAGSSGSSGGDSCGPK